MTHTYEVTGNQETIV